MRFVNSDVIRRAWHRISLPSGETLELGPGEAAELDLAPNTAAGNEEPNGFHDAWLKPAPLPAITQRAKASEAPEDKEQ